MQQDSESSSPKLAGSSRWASGLGVSGGPADRIGLIGAGVLGVLVGAVVTWSPLAGRLPRGSYLGVFLLVLGGITGLAALLPG